MKKLLSILSFAVLSVCIFTLAGIAAEPGTQKGLGVVGIYNPTIKYPGDHPADALLTRNSPNAVWQRIPKIDKLSRVTCSDALNQLKREGKWQGHLKQDGSCGTTAEPANWITGNRLNYEDALEEQRGN